MKNSFFTIKITFLTFFAVILISPQAFAWAGYEESTNVAIDIAPGNLVKEGREITFYDFGSNRYHTSEVIFVEEIFSGTRLEVNDLDAKKKRIFYMER